MALLMGSARPAAGKTTASMAVRIDVVSRMRSRRSGLDYLSDGSHELVRWVKLLRPDQDEAQTGALGK